MPWEVCIVGRVSAAKRVLDKRFEDSNRGEVAPFQEECRRLAKEIIKYELAAAEAMGGDKYITITAASVEDRHGFPEIKMAIRLLPGFVTE